MLQHRPVYIRAKVAVVPAHTMPRHCGRKEAAARQDIMDAWDAMGHDDTHFQQQMDEEAEAKTQEEEWYSWTAPCLVARLRYMDGYIMNAVCLA